MLEIIYRIYEVAEEEEAKRNLEKERDFGVYSSISKTVNNELVMDCLKQRTVQRNNKKPIW